jgi:hypothetical protein
MHYVIEILCSIVLFWKLGHYKIKLEHESIFELFSNDHRGFIYLFIYSPQHTVLKHLSELLITLQMWAVFTKEQDYMLFRMQWIFKTGFGKNGLELYDASSSLWVLT